VPSLARIGLARRVGSLLDQVADRGQPLRAKDATGDLGLLIGHDWADVHRHTLGGRPRADPGFLVNRTDPRRRVGRSISNRNLEHFRWAGPGRCEGET
jgi:hypothetical protein